MHLNQFAKTANKLASEGEAFLFIVDFEKQKPLLFSQCEIPADLYFSFPRKKNHDLAPLPPQKFRFEKFPVAFPVYHKACAHAIRQINKGYSYLLNLTYPTPVQSDLDLKSVFRISRAPYKLLFKDQFVVFSPEIFLRIHGGNMYTYPMKGTIDASIPRAKQIIMNDAKEKAEHNTIVDLLRNDMSIWCSEVTVDRFRFIDNIRTNGKNLLQVSSQISGKLPPDYRSRIGQIIADLLPAGSVSGAPKQASLRIIREAEPESRGYYTGVMGYFDGENLDSAVMIRFIEKQGKKLIYRSGGGITAMSDIKKEYEEMQDKVYVPFY